MGALMGSCRLRVRKEERRDRQANRWLDKYLKDNSYVEKRMDR